MTIKILLFAQLKEKLNTSCWISALEQASLTQLQNTLVETFPEARSVIEASRFAVNQAYVQDLSQAVSAQDEIALIPPVSGG